MFKMISNSVWVYFKAVITKKTIKEEWIDENYPNDNYNTIITDEPQII